MSAINCPLCNFKSPSRSLWLSHLRNVHYDEDGFFVTCGIDGCDASYRKCSSLVSHVYRKHRNSVVSGESIPVAAAQFEILENVADIGTSDQAPEINVVADAVDFGSSNTALANFQHTINQLLGNDDEEQMKKSALFILNLKEIRGLSESAVDHIVIETQKLFNHTFGRLKAGVEDRLSRRTTDLDESVLSSVRDLLESVKDPFHGLKSSFQRENCYRIKLGCLVSTLSSMHL